MNGKMMDEIDERINAVLKSEHTSPWLRAALLSSSTHNIDGLLADCQLLMRLVDGLYTATVI